MSEEELIVRMQRPWSILQLMKGELPNYQQQEKMYLQEWRLDLALDIVSLLELLQFDRKSMENGIARIISEVHSEEKRRRSLGFLGG